MIEISLKKGLQGATGSILLDIELNYESGKIIAITGSSGSGKTTFLRLLGGLLKPENGSISIDGNIWYNSSQRIDLPSQKRPIGFVFQNYSLFPNMTVRGNLEYALDSQQSKSELKEIIEVMELEELTERAPDTLSGGQKQRVALARALVRKPKVLLLDEPLSALDSNMRSKLQDYIIRVHQEFQLSVFIVSHDTTEILRMAHYVCELEEGVITRRGEPSSFFTSRRLSGKFRFTGNIIDISEEDVITVISVMVGNNLVKVIATNPEDQDLQIGDKVILVSKAFNPLIMKVK